MSKKVIPSIHVPIQEQNGSVAWVWYMFFQWIADNAGKVDLSDYYTKEEADELLSAKANTDDLKEVAFTGSYDDLSDKPTIPAPQVNSDWNATGGVAEILNKPTIPTVGDGTITLTQGGVTKGTFTTNQSGDTTIDLDAGGSVVDIDNSTITMNADDEIQANAVINQNAGIVKVWTGTAAEYEALESHDPEVTYQITDDFPRIQPFHKEVADRNIGELVYSLIPLTDAGLHVLNGELLPGEGIYEDFYNYMLSIAVNHPQLFTTEAAWQTSVQTYGVCGKFVIDTANSTIRLPKVTGFVEGTIVQGELGDLVEAGLPNITGNATGFGSGQTHTYSGALFQSGGSSGTFGGSGGNHFNLGFDASRSDSIYGNSTTVQPQAIKGYIYIVLANTVKTETEVDIDNIVTDLDNKVTKGHEVIEFQAPTVQNNYTWYRKYADGWVEQGGVATTTNTSTPTQCNLPVTMADGGYCITYGPTTQSMAAVYLADKQTTYFSVVTGVNNVGYFAVSFNWMVCGMAV